MGNVRGSRDSPDRCHEELLRFSRSVLVTYATAVTLVDMLLHLGDQSNPAQCYVPIGT